MNRVEALKQKMLSGKLVKGFFLTMTDTVVSEFVSRVREEYEAVK